VIVSAGTDASGPWTTNDVAPVITFEVKLASLLVVAAAYDAFVAASPNETAPPPPHSSNTFSKK